MSVLIDTPATGANRLLQQAAEQYAAYQKMQDESGDITNPELHEAAAAWRDSMIAFHDHKRAEHGLAHIQ